ncbi:MAG: hypothetical protein J7M18_03385, partial [Candidatus Eremiobacteraeota bacterium]|nr:hypothetical protein [Candidatus Eremiobacteraeota bacterium]
MKNNIAVVVVFLALMFSSLVLLPEYAMAQINIKSQAVKPVKQTDDSGTPGEPVPSLENNREIRNLTLSPDGKILAILFRSGSDPFDERIALVDMDTRKIKYLPDDHVSLILWSPDSKWLLYKKFYTTKKTGVYMNRVSRGEIRLVDREGEKKKTLYSTDTGRQLYFGTIKWLNGKILYICTDPPVCSWGKKFPYIFMDINGNIINRGTVETPLDANDKFLFQDDKVYFKMADTESNRYLLMEWDPIT